LEKIYDVVIVGAGKVGELLCRDLSLEGNDIILIEQDAKILEKILANNDIMGFVGSGVSYDAQMEAEVPKADVFIAVTEKDEINIISSVIAKKLGAKYTIARVRSTDYSSQLNFMTESLGIDLVINPELEAAKDIKQNIDFPEALNVENFSEKFGLNYLGFLTLTFADNVTNIREASRRFDNLRKCVLSVRYKSYIRVIERTKKGRIHFHLLVALLEDIRTGFNFSSVDKGIPK